MEYQAYIYKCKNLGKAVWQILTNICYPYLDPLCLYTIVWMYGPSQDPNPDMRTVQQDTIPYTKQQIAKALYYIWL